MADEKKAPIESAAQNKPKASGGTAKKATATKKATTAKKTTAKSTATKSTAAKTASKSGTTAKKSTGGTKKTATKSKAADEQAKQQPLITEPTEKTKVEQAEEETALTYIDERAVVPAKTTELDAAKPPLSFPEEMKKRFFARLAVVLGAALILLLSTFIYLWRPTDYTEKTSAVNFLYLKAEDNTLILFDGEILGEAKGSLTSKQENGKGDVCAARFGDALYLITDDAVIHLLSPVADYTLASDGGAIAYRDQSGKLFYRETKEKATPSLITTHSQSEHYSLSPDGKELAYTWLDPQNNAVKLNVESFSANKPQIKENANITPLAITNESRFVYFTDTSGELFIFDAQRGEKIRCGTPDPHSIRFNRDLTEIMFTKSGASVFFVEGVLQNLVGITQSEKINLLPNRRIATRELPYGIQYFTDSFFDNYYYNASGTGKKLMYMDDKGQLSDLSAVDDIETVTVTDKGIFFLQTDQNGENTTTVLYRFEKPTAEKQLLMWDVSHYVTNVDGSKLFYTDTQSTLYLYTHTSGAERMTDSVLAYSLSVTADDLFCYYTEKGVLNVSDNGREPRVLAEGVVVHTAHAHTLLFITDMKEDGTFTVYTNHRNKRKSYLISEGVFSLR